MDTWLTLAQAMSVTGLSERTIRRHIQDGKMQTTKRGGKRLVLVTDEWQKQADVRNLTPDVLITQLQSEINYLREELKAARERSDTIILQLTKQIESDQKLLEYHKTPWWRRLRDNFHPRQP